MACRTSRTARSRNSFGYFLGAGTTPPFRGFEASTKPGAIHRWWTLAELTRCHHKLLPPTLPILLHDILTGRHTDTINLYE